jgi:sigma-B regulation protein RsbU (phosphoserine phosphatase)
MWRKLALLACLAMSGFAQDTVTNATSGPWTAQLNGTWRWHAGDDVRWAAPSFDDSNWSLLKIPGPPPQTAGLYWVRLQVRISGLSSPALLLGPIASAYELYWDGKRLGNFGQPCTRLFVPRWQIFPIANSEAGAGQHTLALRGCNAVYPGARPGRVLPVDNRFGERMSLEEVQTALLARDFQSLLLQLLVVFTILLAGFYFLLLPPSVAQGGAFRWLGAFLIARALVDLNEFYVNFGPLVLPAGVVGRFTWMFVCVGPVFWIEFAYSLFRRRVPWAVRCLEILFLMWAANAILQILPIVGSLAAWTFILGLVPPLAVAADEARKRTSGALVVVAIFSGYAIASLIAIADIFYGAGILSAFELAGFSLWYLDAALLILIPAMAMQIHKINQRFRDEQERLRGEMEAARHVQEILVPSQSINVPGFDIDASYYPATEVGGDFFQLFSASNDALLVVVGDVSGKGMKAALVVSVIVGALQNRRSDAPAALFGELNAVLLGRSEGGFTTCSCALFAADGSLTIASAGHLAPYRNGEEVATPPGLPLGIDADAHWTELRIELEPGDHVLWVSDGVVEARNGKRDLLGFQRAQELASRSASEIAQAAQQFGQEDDITVVSITRVPAPVSVT